MKKNIFFYAIFSIVFSFAFNSCSQKDTPLNQNNQKGPFITLAKSYTLDEIKDLYDDPDLIGLIEITRNYRQEVVTDLNSGVQSNYTATDKDAFAFFWNDDRATGLSVGNIELNASMLKEFSSGMYSKVGNDDLDVYFGGGKYDKFIIDSSETFPGIIDSVMLSAPIQITNITMNQNIPINNDLTINWNGGNQNDIVWIKIMKNSLLSQNDTVGTVVGASKIVDNKGSVVFEKEYLQKRINAGLYDIIALSYEPKYITLSNGKKICFVGISQHTLTVNFTK